MNWRIRTPSAAEEVLGGSSCTGDFLAIDGKGIRVVFFESRVSALFSRESTMTARAANAATAVDETMADRGLGISRERRKICGDILTLSSFVTVATPFLNQRRQVDWTSLFFFGGWYSEREADPFS